MKITHLLLALGLALVGTEASADKLVIKGSDTLGAKLVPQLAEQFKAQNPGTTFDIAAEGSTTGIAAIIDGTAQIGMSSRRAKSAEVAAASGKGVNMKPTIVAYDGIGVIVNAGNPIKGLTKKQVEQIFTGEVTDWSAIGGSGGKISIYTRNTSSGTYSDLKELAMKKRDYAPGSQKMAGQRADRRGSRQERQRHRLRRPGLHESGGDQSDSDRRRHANTANGAQQIMAIRAPDFLLHQWRAERCREAIRRFHPEPGRSEDRAQTGFVPVK